jgi:hypothetical protein
MSLVGTKFASNIQQLHRLVEKALKPWNGYQNNAARIADNDLRESVRRGKEMVRATSVKV